MDSGHYEKQGTQGGISVTVFPDHHEFDYRRQLSSNTVAAQNGIYAGGIQDGNFWMMPGEIALSRRNAALECAGGEYHEKVVTSLSGFYYGAHASIEAAMRFWKFACIITSEYRTGDVQQAENGCSGIALGSGSIIAEIVGDIYPGDLLIWQFPSAGSGINVGANHQAGGEPFGKRLVQVKRYNPLEFDTQLSSVYQNITLPMPASPMDESYMGGLLGSTIADYFSAQEGQGAVNLDSLTEEGLAIVNGAIMIGLLIHRRIQADAGVNVDVQVLAQRYGLWAAGGVGHTQDNDQAIINKKRLMATIMVGALRGSADQVAKDVRDELIGSRIVSGNNGAPAAVVRNTGPESLLNMLAYSPLELLMGGVASAQSSRRERVFAKAMGGSGPGKRLDAIVGGLVK